MYLCLSFCILLSYCISKSFFPFVIIYFLVIGLDLVFNFDD